TKLFQTEATSGSDPTLKNFAGTTLPTVQDHLRMARAERNLASSAASISRGLGRRVAPPLKCRAIACEGRRKARRLPALGLCPITTLRPAPPASFFPPSRQAVRNSWRRAP